MPHFLSDPQKAAFLGSREPVHADYKWALAMRCLRRSAQPGLLGPGATMAWWHAAHEYVSDAAMHVALTGDANVGAWLRSVALDLSRRSEDDWVGPGFRNHTAKPPVGHLETAHLSWAISLALDLAPGVFRESERDELIAVLRDRAIPMCRRFLEGPAGTTLANWRCVLGAGLAVPAAILKDEAALDEAERLFKIHVECFQEDGSYGESLQYGHYAMYALTLHYEALVRARPALLASLPIERYARGLIWQAASLLHRKPAEGFGPAPRAWSANFNDSGAIYSPSADVLLQISSRLKGKNADLSGLARWIHDTFTPPVPDPEPHDQSSFGFLPRFGFLALVHLAGAAQARTPEQIGLGAMQSFDNGDTIARDHWGGETVLAVRGGGPALNGLGHLHGDLGSFILTHREERLLADPGHSCYRGLVHATEVQSQTHNTLTFRVPGPHGELVLQQGGTPVRKLQDGVPGPAIDRGARRLLSASLGQLRVTASEFGRSYGDPIRTCERFWILCGSHALFIVDHVVATTPVRTVWNWVLDNHDRALELKDPGEDRLICRRGASGMKLFHCGGGRFAELASGWMHLAYHPMPGQRGEGAAGSAAIARFIENEPALERWAVHAIAVDGYGPVAYWHLKNAALPTVLEAPYARERWALRIDPAGDAIVLQEECSSRHWRVEKTEDEKWTLNETPNGRTE
ncbi:MAG: heparinase II/III family protein [Spirochaetes bacterium]|nr:heparinase II/III family protein [Spirochaetota bacterium]